MSNRFEGERCPVNFADLFGEAPDIEQRVAFAVIARSPARTKNPSTARPSCDEQSLPPKAL